MSRQYSDALTTEDVFGYHIDVRKGERTKKVID